MQFRRGGLLVATLSTVLYGGLVLAQYFAASGLLHDSWLASHRSPCRPRSVARYTCRAERVRLLRGRAAQRVTRRRRAVGRRPPRAGVDAGSPTCRRSISTSSTACPSGLATTDIAQRILTFNRAAEMITGMPVSAVVGRPIAEVLQLPPEVLEALDRGPHGIPRATDRVPLPDDRRPR